ncbi:hypothetical protein CC80DRAFT_150182 [Byssothecium circinans]|uniref:Uncharacterized protein n=1 Tax=Byssothecium circinans TaxID=147558 RepID=A0A6A5TRS1_9PLEO|nr:hypothetical protein CC80DRAFT_150182 [Byssothecium circinans]
MADGSLNSGSAGDYRVVALSGLESRFGGAATLLLYTWADGPWYITVWFGCRSAFWEGGGGVIRMDVLRGKGADLGWWWRSVGVLCLVVDHAKGFVVIPIIQRIDLLEILFRFKLSPLALRLFVRRQRIALLTKDARCNTHRVLPVDPQFQL